MGILWNLGLKMQDSLLIQNPRWKGNNKTDAQHSSLPRSAWFCMEQGQIQGGRPWEHAPKLLWPQRTAPVGMGSKRGHQRNSQWAGHWWDWLKLESQSTQQVDLGSNTRCKHRSTPVQQTLVTENITFNQKPRFSQLVHLGSIVLNYTPPTQTLDPPPYSQFSAGLGTPSYFNWGSV